MPGTEGILTGGAPLDQKSQYAVTGEWIRANVSPTRGMKPLRARELLPVPGVQSPRESRK
jgi:hypothetical protein